MRGGGKAVVDGRPRRLPAAERRSQIVDVTTAVVAERGFWGMALQDVADGCGLTVPGILRHFPTKTDLVLAVLEHRDRVDGLHLLRELGGEELGRTADLAGPRALADLCEAIVARNAGQLEVVRLFLVLQGEALSPVHPAHRWFAVRRDEVHRGMVLLLPPGRTDADQFAWSVLAALEGVQLVWLARPGSDLVDSWRAVADRLFAPADDLGTTSGRGGARSG